VALTANDNSTTSGYVADQTAYSGNADGYAYRLFDHSLSSAYQSANTQYSGGISTSSAQTTTATDGSTHQGVAITLDLATKIRLSYAKITSHTFYGRTPADGSFLGSNDNTTWDLIGTFSGLSTSAVGQTHTVHIADYTTKAVYRYMRLVVTRTSDSLNLLNGGTLLEFKELEYYGHEEGSGSLDTTLKTVYNVPATTGTQLEVYYDAKNLADGALSTTSGAIPGLGGTTVNGTAYGDPQVSNEAFVFDGNDYISTTVTGLTGTSVTMSVWVNVNSIDTSRINSIIGLGTYDTGTAGSSTWIAIDSSQRFYTGLVGLDQTVENTSAFTNNWVHLTAIVGTTELSLYQDGLLIGKVNGGTFNLGSNPVLYLGTRSDGSGNPESTRHFTGSIANFRLYSKALNAGQVQELYDYQKDYFLGSKSQVTLYKGHLGVGVTEPSGQLELAGDERIQEYPPRGMTDFDTNIEGHGVFCASASSTLDPNNWPAYKAFNKTIANTGDAWVSPDARYSTVDGLPTSIVSKFYDGVAGEWIQLDLPYSIKLKQTFLYEREPQGGSYAPNTSPRDVRILGKKQKSEEWVEIFSVSDLVYTQQQGNTPKILNVNSNDFYSSYVLQLTRIGGPDGADAPPYGWADVAEIKYFGTPGPTTLDKGSLTLGRSLDVPRISRYDVDTETPRPEKLVVDFDTTVNNSPTDISGQGNHGTLVGATYYSAPDKAFKFDGNQDFIETRSGSNVISGSNPPFTASVWIKYSGSEQGYVTPFSIEPATYGTNTNVWFYIRDTTKKPTLQFENNYVEFSEPGTSTGGATSNTWHHLAVTFNGSSAIGGRRCWLNGIEQVSSAVAGSAAGGTLTLGTTRLTIGSMYYNNAHIHEMIGFISNFKLYNVALEPSEVKKLYRLGRTGRSMVISDTAVGIGKVPEAQLDVRGAVRFDRFTDKLRIDSPAGYQLSIGRSDAYLNEFRWYAWGSGCNWYTPYTGKGIYIGRDGETISEYNFWNVTTVKKGGTTLHSSDDRLKRDEAFITNATDTLLKLKPQTYIKKHRLPENENDTDIPEQFEAGLIAQDVWYDAPELRFLVHPSKDANPSETKPVSPDPNDPTQDPDYSSWGTTQAYVNYEGFLPYLIKSNQEIYTELQAEKVVTTENKDLTRELRIENNRLKSKVTILENRQTHFNTLLVNLIGRIETLERPT
jgi:hypothetical protein